MIQNDTAPSSFIFWKGAAPLLRLIYSKSKRQGKMAANFGALRSFSAFPFLPLYNKPYPLLRSFSSTTLRFLRHHLHLHTMGQQDPHAATNTTNGSEIQEPLPKIAKLHQNGDVSAETPLLRVKKLSDKAILPSRASSLSAGYDLSSAVEIKVPARGKAMVATDISISIPEGTYARVAPRSGLAWKHSIDVGAGVIDADYRGPVGVILFNCSDVDFVVTVGDRVAQLILEKIVTPDVVEVEELDSTVRGEGGFGSTGV